MKYFKWWLVTSQQLLSPPREKEGKGGGEREGVRRRGQEGDT